MTNRAGQVPPDPTDDQLQTRLPVKIIDGRIKDIMESGNGPSQHHVIDGRSINRGPNQIFADGLGVDVEDPFPESLSGASGLAVMGHVRRQDGDSPPVRTPFVLGQAVANLAAVDDEYRPGVVAVKRVGVVVEAGVKDLRHPGQSRPPRPNLVNWRPWFHANNVQEPVRRYVLTGPMTPGWKLAVAVREDLEVWQKLNVTAFVTSGFGSAHPALIGKNYVDGSGIEYLPKLGLPVLIYAADGPAIRRAFDRARGRDLAVSVYTDELFRTGNDVDNRAAVAAVSTADLVIAGFAAAGEAKQVDKAFDKLRFHP